MNIGVYSDLHLEFAPFEPDLDRADVLVLAGDIHIGSKALDWLAGLSLNIPVLYVLGNHEYYKHTYPKLVTKLREQARGTNIQVLHRDVVVLDGVAFHGATLWTDFKLQGLDPRIAGFECQQVMTDYKKIRVLPNYSKLRSIDTALAHERDKAWLRESLLGSTAKYNVVISHHAPSMKSIQERDRQDVASNAYASSMEYFIRDTLPNLWIHGHVHHSCDYWIDDCRVVSNPRGYHNENPDFNPSLQISLSS